MSRFRNFVFTINNPEHAPVFEDWMDYLVYQGEMGEEGTFHFQGYCEIAGKQQLSLRQLKEWEPTAHIEKRRGTAKQAIAYCKKDDTRIEGPFEFGEPKEQGSRNDKLEIYAMVQTGASQRQIAEAMPAAYMGNYKAVDRLISMHKPAAKPRQVRLLYGEPGTGKTRYVLEHHPDAYVIPVTSGQLWFDGYDNHDVALIDDFNGQIPLIQFLRILHEYPEQVPIKGGHVWWNPSIIYITSNYTVRNWYEGKDGSGWNNREPSYEALMRRINAEIYFPLQIDHPLAAAGQGDNPDLHLGEMDIIPPHSPELHWIADADLNF